MNSKTIESKYNSLKKIYKIVESKKNITLVNLLRLSKQIGYCLDRANYSKFIIEQIINKYSINDFALNKKSDLLTLGGLKTLWIYITEEEKYSTNSYQKHEKYLLQAINKSNDSIIAIGQKAIKFASDNGFNILFSFEKNEVDYLNELLPKIIINNFKINDYANLNFVINSTKIKEKHIQLLPVNMNNFTLKHHQNSQLLNSNINTHKISQDLNEFIDSETESYLNFAISSLLTESALIYEKYKLVAQNSTLNDLEEKIKFQKRQFLKVKREKEIEQISMLSKKKDLLHEIRKGN
ncbi:MSC_0622 family F1-like ATPase gamma subunit [Mycoplasma sp. 4404]|uniref:MSC_0622 family F1-like ATPase gamma subunit n=1 Tax=Mycoplasma sp. 4404 TaxID=3108530 RepID=UPI002B1D084D|nr:hypothetical protein [Mycoplasma sp. 4404]MEA4162636.1 hypothetical protein [Mycoplasma sp. 4404]